MYGVLEKQVWELREENKELKETINEMQKQIDEIKNSEKSEFREIIVKMKEEKGKIEEFNKKLADFLNWKESIDAIIDKIKKILHIW